MTMASAGAIRGEYSPNGNVQSVYSSPLDLPYWAMRSAPYRLIRWAIEIASEVGAFFSVVDFMSCINVAKRPWYGQVKIKPSYTIVLYYALM
jgi:hypothetical protein